MAAATADADHAEEVAAGTRVQADADSHRVVAAAHPEPFTAVPSERADATDAPVDLDVIADTGIAL
ncbi:MAG: hypothetical protein L0H59_18555 [Tomitella sp.]|nr:hypothetical protein [Tomitella sp.]